MAKPDPVMGAKSSDATETVTDNFWRIFACKMANVNYTIAARPWATIFTFVEFKMLAWSGIGPLVKSSARRAKYLRLASRRDSERHAGLPDVISKSTQSDATFAHREAIRSGEYVDYNPQASFAKINVRLITYFLSLFLGQYQPHRPIHPGFFDLRLPD